MSDMSDLMVVDVGKYSVPVPKQWWDGLGNTSLGPHLVTSIVSRFVSLYCARQPNQEGHRDEEVRRSLNPKP